MRKKILVSLDFGDYTVSDFCDKFDEVLYTVESIIFENSNSKSEVVMPGAVYINNKIYHIKYDPVYDNRGNLINFENLEIK